MPDRVTAWSCVICRYKLNICTLMPGTKSNQPSTLTSVYGTNTTDGSYDGLLMNFGGVWQRPLASSSSLNGGLCSPA